MHEINGITIDLIVNNINKINEEVLNKLSTMYEKSSKLLLEQERKQMNRININKSKLQTQHNYRVIWKCPKTEYGTLLYKDMLIREYIKGTMEAQGYRVGEIIIKRKIKEMSIIIQIEKEIEPIKKGKSLIGIQHLMLGMKKKTERVKDIQLQFDQITIKGWNNSVRDIIETKNNNKQLGSSDENPLKEVKRLRKITFLDHKNKINRKKGKKDKLWNKNTYKTNLVSKKIRDNPRIRRKQDLQSVLNTIYENLLLYVKDVNMIIHVQQIEPWIHSSQLIGRYITLWILKRKEYKRIFNTVINKYKNINQGLDFLQPLQHYDWVALKHFRRIYLLWITSLLIYIAKAYPVSPSNLNTIFTTNTNLHTNKHINLLKVKIVGAPSTPIATSKFNLLNLYLFSISKSNLVMQPLVSTVYTSAITKALLYFKLHPYCIHFVSSAFSIYTLFLQLSSLSTSYVRSYFISLILKGLLDYLLLMELSLLKFKGIRLYLSGRLPGRGGKSARAKHFSAHYGNLSLSSLTIPSQYSSSTIFTKLGAIGLKIFLR